MDEAGLDIALECRGGETVRISSNKVIKASSCETFRDIIAKAKGEGNGLLRVPEDDVAGWLLCWALISDAVNRPAVQKANFTAALQLAHKYQLDGVLFKCQDMFICSLLCYGNYMSLSSHQQQAASLVNCVTLNIHWDPAFAKHDVTPEDVLRFLGLLSSVGLTTAYKMAFHHFTVKYRDALRHHLKEHMKTHCTLTDWPELSKHLISWLLR